MRDVDLLEGKLTELTQNVKLTPNPYNPVFKDSIHSQVTPFRVSILLWGRVFNSYLGPCTPWFGYTGISAKVRDPIVGSHVKKKTTVF